MTVIWEAYTQRSRQLKNSNLILLLCSDDRFYICSQIELNSLNKHTII